MSYPDSVKATLDSVNGNAVSDVWVEFSFNSSASPPAYDVGAKNNVRNAHLVQITDGGTTSWELYIWSLNPAGHYSNKLSTPADDPIGAYCNSAGGCGASEASTEDIS